MKTLLKVLGVAAGLYVVSDFGCVIGVLMTSEYYEGRFDKHNKKDKRCIESITTVQDVFGKHYNVKAKKSSKKRSEILRKHAKKWAEEGFSSEEIKQGLELLKKELD
jgi:hypothetical protein